MTLNRLFPGLATLLVIGLEFVWVSRGEDNR
jgi:hypothetical protein